MNPIDLSTLPQTWKISHDNWLIAEAFVRAWTEIEEIDEADKEFVETHPLNPNRRPPSPPKLSAAATHPSRGLAEQQISPQPQGAWEQGERQGYHWGYFQTLVQTQQGVAPLKIAIDADSRESALMLHQSLQLLTLDPQMALHLVQQRVERVRVRQNLNQLGHCDGQGVFSLRDNQTVPQMAIVAAHQLGHLVHGASDDAADWFASDYSERNQPAFAAWRAQSPVPVLSPDETIKQGLAFLKKHIPPEDYQKLKGYRLNPNENTPNATPQDIATHLTFVGIQQNIEQQLRSQGVPVSLPMEMPDCISHKAVGVSMPRIVDAPLSVVAPPTDHEWRLDPQLPQRAGSYPESVWEHSPLSVLSEGGRCIYRGIEIVGLKRSVERIQRALDECWADPEAKQKVFSKVKRIYAATTPGVWGLSAGGGQTSAQYNRNIIDIAGTIFHEALHEDGLGEDQHPLIRRLQDAFVQRRRSSLSTPATALLPPGTVPVTSPTAVSIPGPTAVPVSVGAAPVSRPGAGTATIAGPAIAVPAAPGVSPVSVFQGTRTLSNGYTEDIFGPPQLRSQAEIKAFPVARPAVTGEETKRINRLLDAIQRESLPHYDYICRNLKEITSNSNESTGVSGGRFNMNPRSFMSSCSDMHIKFSLVHDAAHMTCPRANSSEQERYCNSVGADYLEAAGNPFYAAAMRAADGNHYLTANYERIGIPL